MTKQDEKADGKRGLGHVVYSTEPKEVREDRIDDSDVPDVIEEASEDSFPSSDPQGYSRGAPANPDVEPDSQAATEHPPASQEEDETPRSQPPKNEP